MNRYFTAVLFTLLLPVCASSAAECSLPLYNSLLAEGKNAAAGREWSRSVELYSHILGDCRSLVSEKEFPGIYDALSAGQWMQGSYAAAIESSLKCLAYDPKYNACMMTAAKAYDALGDRGMALGYARSAVEVGAYDDYSAAVISDANAFLKMLEKRTFNTPFPP